MDFMSLSSVGFNDATFNAGIRRENTAAGRAQDFETMLKNAYSAKEDSENVSAERPAARPGNLPGSMPIDKTDKLYELCLELETFIIKNLLNGMRNTVQKSGLIDDSFAGKMYEDMLYDEYAKDFTKSAGFGLADQAYRQLTRMY